MSEDPAPSDPKVNATAKVVIYASELRRWSNTYDSGPTMRTTELWVDADVIDRRVEVRVVDAPELDGLYVVDGDPNPSVLRLTTIEPCL